MKVEKNSVRRTLCVTESHSDDLGFSLLKIGAVRHRGAHLSKAAFSHKKLIRLKGDCRKRRFRDLAEAQAALHQIERYRKFSGESGVENRARLENRAYRCPTCLGAHLTSKPLLSEVVMQVA